MKINKVPSGLKQQYSFIHIHLIVKSCQNAALHENSKQYSKNNTANRKFIAEAADKTYTVI